MILRWIATAVFALLAVGAARADTMVINVNGVTIDDKGQPQRFAALQFGPDGKVKALFQSKDKRPKTEYQIDGKGRTLIPGLIDAHLHVMELGFGALTLDLSGTKSLAEAQAKIRAYAAAHPDRAWITGRGWNQEAWGLGRFPTATDLNAAAAIRSSLTSRCPSWAGA